MSIKRTLTTLFLTICILSPQQSNAQDTMRHQEQNQEQTHNSWHGETETHIFWQIDRPLTLADFHGDGSTNEKSVRYCEQHGMCTVAFLGLLYKIDIPNKKSVRKGIRQEVVYMTPAFEKAGSYTLKDNDEFGLMCQQFLYDNVELATRRIRKGLQEFQDIMHGATGTKAVVFNRVYTKSKEMMDDIGTEFTHSVILKNDMEAYHEWRQFMSEALEILEEYATTPEELTRFIEQKPLIPNYMELDYIY